MSSLQPIKLLPARERISAAMREAILKKELKANQEITLEDMAEQLGVSITPVREAFQLLASDGLIKLRPNKGAIVLGITEKTVRDHFETRALLEGETAARVCKNNADIAEILNAHEHAQTAISQHNTHEYSNYNQAFHYAIWAAADNKKMESILSSMWNGLSIGHEVTQETYARQSSSEHADIVEAIKEKNAELARQRMSEHILRSLENFLTNLSRE